MAHKKEQQTMIRRTSPLFLALGLALLMGASGCKSKKEAPLDTDLTGSGSGFEDTSSGTGLPDVDQESLLFSRDQGLQTVYFDYDSSSLRSDAMATLSENAAKINNVPNVIIQIAGHCDERGTENYNIALGERRALAVRDHLISLGVSGSRLITISFGEEMPAVEGTNEAAWRYNRRAEFNRAQAM
jgi:peptidoglycan-associated lipoprotein